MDSQRFDVIAKTLARSRSRRALARGFAGGLVPLFVGTEQAAAACLAIGNLCDRTRQCCGGRRKKSRCAVNEHAGTPDEPSCCARQGKTCNDSSDCCSGPCTDGKCAACTALRGACTSLDQCCSTDRRTSCAPNNVVISQNVCCSTLGGACESGGPSGDCCQVGVPSGVDYAYCPPGGGTCGGAGATCRFNEVCVSGVCCKNPPTADSGVCCQTGQTCDAGACVG